MINYILGVIQINSPLPRTSSSLLENVLYIVFGTLGGISLIMMIWAGMKYTLSRGDPAKTTEAKNQIMYAAIGLAVAMTAPALFPYVLIVAFAQFGIAVVSAGAAEALCTASTGSKTAGLRLCSWRGCADAVPDASPFTLTSARRRP